MMDDHRIIKITELLHGYLYQYNMREFSLWDFFNANSNHNDKLDMVEKNR